MAMRSIIWIASTGYCPTADSADSMTASAPSNTAVATSETSARVGTGARDHAFQHLRRDDDRLTGGAGLARDLLLQAGHLLDRHLDAEIAARNHEAVGGGR